MGLQIWGTPNLSVIAEGASDFAHLRCDNYGGQAGHQLACRSRLGEGRRPLSKNRQILQISECFAGH